ncbi:MAG: putative pyruvate formate lyase activating enzyme [Candidatus Atribacteria bacterium]|nr:putative pyruvate formate lyase activating enzyme [Candidatus Atribacteria bacterium]
MLSGDQFFSAEARVAQVAERLTNCDLCPRNCGVNRSSGEKGICQGGALPKIFAYHPHWGEEFLLSGKRGSGTIFFSGCNMKCVYCQNYEISQEGKGREITIEHLRNIMLFLEQAGCHNVNLVTPTHFAPQIFSAVLLAQKRGLTIPIVYNTVGYERVEILREWRGLVDIYLPDMRYASGESSERYSGVADYPEVNQQAVLEMYRQVGEVDVVNGVAEKGLIIRILLLPGLEDEARTTLTFIANEISRKVFISLMRQYRPLFRAFEFPELSRTISDAKYRELVQFARRLGLENLILQ